MKSWNYRVEDCKIVNTIYFLWLRTNKWRQKERIIKMMRSWLFIGGEERREAGGSRSFGRHLQGLLGDTTAGDWRQVCCFVRRHHHHEGHGVGLQVSSWGGNLFDRQHVIYCLLWKCLAFMTSLPAAPTVTVTFTWPGRVSFPASGWVLASRETQPTFVE